jgi:cytochrome c553
MRLLHYAAVAVLLFASATIAQTPDLAQRQAEAAAALADRQEEETVLADGEGRSEVFSYCTACHNTALIRRSAFTRERWDELMDWMAEKHGMNPLEGEFRDTIVDYLARYYGPRARGPRGGNPFLN